MPGPHGFAVRISTVRLRAGHSLTRFISPCDRICAPDAAASTASRPASVTIASRPSVGRDRRVCKSDLPDGLSEIFFESGLDSDFSDVRADLPDGQFFLPADEI